MEEEKLRIAHITDLHIRKSYAGNPMEAIFQKEEDPEKKLRWMLKRAVQEQADCLLITGDIVHEGGEEDYAYVKDVVTEVVGEKMKIFYACGNHDRKPAFQKVLLGGAKTADYTGYVKGYRVVVLDSSVEGKENGCITPEQEEWLAETLKEDFGKGTLLAFHHPVSWELEALSMPVSENFQRIIHESDVCALFTGHTHSNRICFWNGIIQYTADAMAFGMEMLSKERLGFVEKAGMNFYEIRRGRIAAHVEAMEFEPKVLADFDLKMMMKFVQQ